MRFSYLSALLISLLIGAITFAFCKVKKYDAKRLIYVVLLSMYFAAVFGLTILCKFPSFRSYSLIPFNSYAKNFEMGNVWFFIQEALNIVLFIPFGFLVSFKKKNPKQIVLYGFLFSLLIEIIQLIVKRGSFDINDLMWNTLGTFFGVLLHNMIQKGKNND